MSETPETAELDPKRAREVLTRATVDYYRSGAFMLGVTFPEWLQLLAEDPERCAQLIEAGERFLDLVVGKLAGALGAAVQSPEAAARIFDDLAETNGGAQRELAVRRLAREALSRRAAPEPVVRGGPS